MSQTRREHAQVHLDLAFQEKNLHGFISVLKIAGLLPLLNFMDSVDRKTNNYLHNILISIFSPDLKEILKK
ncbi:MAG: hypothetical protein NUV87_00315 [Candidatus Roizmanbacteria bacterium]|nr:hypothetical protein [Candidatus Roizmanbacteria bacterium]MCR4312944.1 hypothetical protein [Candidatus Roizmanbacteria bacterium]